MRQDKNKNIAGKKCSNFAGVRENLCERKKELGVPPLRAAKHVNKRKKEDTAAAAAAPALGGNVGKNRACFSGGEKNGSRNSGTKFCKTAYII